MKELIITCPCCDQKIKIKDDDNGNISIFSLDEDNETCHSPTIEELENLGIGFGTFKTCV